MKLKTAAMIATAIVIILGAAMISPLFFRPAQADKRVLLSFAVIDSNGASEWCSNLSSVLDSYDLPATVFIVGEIAQQYPQTATCFCDKVDVGSRTYSNAVLTTINDYTVKLQEVQDGKSSVDAAGDLSSKVFQAPSTATDQDIYSLLNRAGILADFSYKDHYNVYKDGQFVRYPASVFDGCSYAPEFFLQRPQGAKPTIIQFNNTCSTEDIQAFLATLCSGDFEFVNASQLTGLALTVREA